MERANNALAVVADITWMYNPEYEVYNRLFDIIPREVILHGIFSTEQVPDWEYNILDIGRVMYDTSPDYQKYNYSEFIDDLNDVIELFIHTIIINITHRFIFKVIIFQILLINYISNQRLTAIQLI